MNEVFWIESKDTLADKIRRELDAHADEDSCLVGCLLSMFKKELDKRTDEVIEQIPEFLYERSAIFEPIARGSESFKQKLRKKYGIIP